MHVGDRRTVLLDIDGVLHVGDYVIPGAIAALTRIRARADAVVLVTNTSSRPRSAVAATLRQLGFDVADEEIITPSALAAGHCLQRGYKSVGLLVDDALRADLGRLPVRELDGELPVDAVLVGDIGERFGAGTLNPAFRALVDGAELIALGHNRFYARPSGLMLDVGSWCAALTYGSGREATVLGKPSQAFFAAALGQIGAVAADAVMVGDDVETDVGGAIQAGLAGILVRTGKYRDDRLTASGIRPTAIIDSIADLPDMLGL